MGSLEMNGHIFLIIFSLHMRRWHLLLPKRTESHGVPPDYICCSWVVYGDEVLHFPVGVLVNNVKLFLALKTMLSNVSGNSFHQFPAQSQIEFPVTRQEEFQVREKSTFLWHWHSWIPIASVYVMEDNIMIAKPSLCYLWNCIYQMPEALHLAHS